MAAQLLKGTRKRKYVVAAGIGDDELQRPRTRELVFSTVSSAMA
jgi:hypothetical protein